MRNLVWFEKTNDGIISGRRDVVLHVQLQAGQQLMGQSKKLCKSFLLSFSPDLVVLYPKVDFLQKLGTLLNPFTPGNFAEKQVLSRLTIL